MVQSPGRYRKERTDVISTNNSIRHGNFNYINLIFAYNMSSYPPTGWVTTIRVPSYIYLILHLPRLFYTQETKRRPPQRDMTTAPCPHMAPRQGGNNTPWNGHWWVRENETTRPLGPIPQLKEWGANWLNWLPRHCFNTPGVWSYRQYVLGDVKVPTSCFDVRIEACVRRGSRDRFEINKPSLVVWSGRSSDVFSLLITIIMLIFCT